MCLPALPCLNGFHFSGLLRSCFVPFDENGTRPLKIKILQFKIGQINHCVKSDVILSYWTVIVVVWCWWCSTQSIKSIHKDFYFIIRVLLLLPKTTIHNKTLNSNQFNSMPIVWNFILLNHSFCRFSTTFIKLYTIPFSLLYPLKFMIAILYLLYCIGTSEIFKNW